MRILFAIGIAVSTLLLTSCTNPDTSGGVTMQKEASDGSPFNRDFPDAECRPLPYLEKTNYKCGYYTNQNIPSEPRYFIGRAPAPCANCANFNGAELSGANLSGADLRGANLYRANLEGANLHGANLMGATLLRANLSGANLSGAILMDTDLSETNVIGANFTWANLTGAHTGHMEGNTNTICPNGNPQGYGGGGDCPF